MEIRYLKKRNQSDKALKPLLYWLHSCSFQRFQYMISIRIVLTDRDFIHDAKGQETEINTSKEDNT